MGCQSDRHRKTLYLAGAIFMSLMVPMARSASGPPSPQSRGFDQPDANGRAARGLYEGDRAAKMMRLGEDKED